MTNRQDPVDRALSALQRIECPIDQQEHQLEMQIMNQLHEQSRLGRFTRRQAMVASVAALALVSAGVAAGIAINRSLNVTTEINGEVVDSRTVVLDENGDASFTVPMPEITDDTATMSFTVESDEVPAGEGDGTVVLSMTAEDVGDGEATVNIHTEEVEED